VASKNILVNSVHPGGVDTELGRHIVEVIEKFLGKATAEFIHEHVMPRGGRGAWTASDASLTQIYAAVAPAVLNNKISGKYFHPIARQTVPDPHAANKKLQAHLWQLTENFIAKKA
jgi:hypothetical protein